MKAAMEFTALQFPAENIKLSAQSHLASYYEAHGFKICGEGYLEDGIPHVPMKYISASSQ
jgi:ElaA protein